MYTVHIVHNVHNVYSVYMICLIFGTQMMFWNIIFWLLLGLYDINMVENRLVCVKSRDFNFHEPVILSKELTLTFGNIKLKVRTK